MGLLILVRCRRQLAYVWLFAAVSAASFLTILPFFLQNFTRTHWLGAGGVLNILDGLWDNAVRLSWYFNDFGLRAAMLAAAVGGVCVLARRGRAQLWAGLALSIMPVAVIIAGKFAWVHEPRYMLFLLPVILLVMGKGVMLALPERFRLSAVLVVLGGLAMLVMVRGNQLYDDTSSLALVWVKPKVAARLIPTVSAPGQLFVASETGLTNSLDWYLERQGAPNPLRSQRLTPDQPEAMVNFLWFEAMGHLAKTPEELGRRFPGLVKVGDLDKITLYKAVVQRQPVRLAGTLPWEETLEGPEGFWGKSYAMQGLTLSPFWGGELQAAANGVPGHVEYVVDNDAENAPQRLEIAARYVNAGQDNLLRVKVRFDDEPWQDAFASTGPDRHVYRRALVARMRPYRRLTVRVELTCAMVTAMYPGGNLESLGLKQLVLALTPL